MGNCCKVSEKPKQKFAKMTEASSGGFLYVVTETGVQVKVVYCGNVPVMGLKEQVKEQCPEVELHRKVFFKDDLPILDETATLSQLGIAQGDVLQLRISEEDSQDIIISEVESTSAKPKFIVEGVSLKDSLNNRNSKLSPKKSAQELWRTAMPIPQTTKLINREAIEASSLSNITHGSFQPLTCSFQVGFNQPSDFTLNENNCFNSIFRD